MVWPLDQTVYCVPLHVQVSGPLENKSEEKVIGNAQFRWQRCASTASFFNSVEILMLSLDNE